jgi:hypothetical protein
MQKSAGFTLKMELGEEIFSSVDIFLLLFHEGAQLFLAFKAT